MHLVEFYEFEPCKITDTEGTEHELPRGSATVSDAQNATTEVTVMFHPRSRERKPVHIAVPRNELERLVQGGLARLKW